MASAFSVTALELVNRVHARRRMPSVSSLNELEDVATLNAVNSAIEDVLESQAWQFDNRNDGQITLRGRRDAMTFTGTYAGAGVPYNQISIIDTLGVGSGGEHQDALGASSVLRLDLAGDANYGQTSVRVTASLNVASFRICQVATSFYKDISTTTGIMYFSEYILPSTVAAVNRVTYHEDQVTLEQVDPSIEYEELFPRPQIEYGEPEVVAVGGLDLPTYTSGASTPSVGLRMAVWPVPDDDYVLHYSYRYRHPELVDATDTLDGVPTKIVSQIVDIAATDMKIYYEQDYNALALRRSNQERVERSHGTHGASKGARKPIGNWDSRGRGSRYERGFPGKLIG